MGGIEVVLSLLIFIAIIFLLIFIFRDKIEIRIGEFRYGVFGEDPTPTGGGTPTPTGSGTPTPTGAGTPTPTGSGTPTPTGGTNEGFWIFR